jgi:ABC-type multidrug transport system ATPase subunit
VSIRTGLKPATMPVAALGITRSFGDHRVLDGVDLTVEPGQVVALLGPNGAGKTTMLRILIGMVDQEAGSLTMFGHTWAREGRLLRERIGYVPAGERTFYLRLSGLENLVFFARLHGVRLADSKREAARLISLVGLDDAASRRVGIYSHGMQRRLALARALIGDPHLLVLDEVTSGLDPEAASTAKQIAREATDRGASVLWTTQRIEEVRGLADSVVLLHRGLVRFAGSVPELMAQARGDAYLVEFGDTGRDPRELFDNDRGLLDGFGRLQIESGEGRIAELSLDQGVSIGVAVSRLVSAGFDIEACRESKDPIEAAFMHLIEDKR